MESELRLDVLGVTTASRNGEALALRPRERDVLAGLALDPGARMSASDLAEVVWAGAPPATAAVTLQNHVSRLRRGAGREAIRTEDGGYRLGGAWSTDIERRSAQVAQAASWRRVGRAGLAVGALDEAIGLRRGLAFSDLGESAAVGVERGRQEETARSIEDDLLVALLLAGATSRAVIDAEALAVAEPFREVRWAALAVALYRDGQRREAVRALRRGQEVLRERVGLDVGPTLQRLESLVFDDDQALLTASPLYLLGRPGAGEPGIRSGLVVSEAGDRPLDTSDLVRAAREAIGDDRFADAAELWRLAADRSEQDEGADAVATLHFRLDEAEALELAGDERRAALVPQVVELAAEVGGDVFGRAVSALCRLGPFTEPGPRNEEAAALIERAIGEVEDPAILSECHCEAALFASLTGELDLADRHYEQSIAIARSTGDARILLDALSATYAIVTHPADQERRAALAAEMLAVAERSNDDDGRFTALHLYFAVQVIGADPLVRTTFRQQEVLARSLRRAARRWMAAYQRACLAYLDGRLDDALEIAEDAFATAPVAPARANSAYGMQLLLVRVAQGRGDELAGLVDAAIVDQPELPAWRAVAAWLASMRGDRARVAHECQLLSDGRALPPDMTWGGSVMILARAAAAVGITDALPTLTDLLAPFSGQFTWYGAGTVGPYDLALAELALAAGDRGLAQQHLVVAQRVVTEIGAVVFQPDLDAIGAAIRAP
jgi:DNA-binding SARP family transcriptional activator